MFFFILLFRMCYLIKKRRSKKSAKKIRRFRNMK